MLLTPLYSIFFIKKIIHCIQRHTFLKSTLSPHTLSSHLISLSLSTLILYSTSKDTSEISTLSAIAHVQPSSVGENATPTRHSASLSATPISAGNGGTSNPSASLSRVQTAPRSAPPQTNTRPVLDTVDAAQALLGLMHASPTSSAPPEGISPLWSKEKEPPRSATSAGGETRMKRRKRAVEMSPEELQHARETNKRSAQQFRERERVRRQELKAKGEMAQRTNEELKKEKSGLLIARKELADEIKRVMPASPLLAPPQTFEF